MTAARDRPSPEEPSLAMGGASPRAASLTTTEEMRTAVGPTAVREALRPPNLPLPSPRSVVEAAHRVHDLAQLGRHAEAQHIAESFAAEPSSLVERAELLTVHAAAQRRAGHAEDADAVLRELVGLLDGAGLCQMARAMVVALDLQQTRSRGARRADRGRRRANPLADVTIDELDDEALAVLAVVRGVMLPAPPPAADWLDPARLADDEGRYLSAIEVLPGVRDLVLGDPEPLLRLRYAQVLDLQARDEAASEQAAEALELMRTAAGADESRAPIEVGERTATSARAVLARTLRASDPLAAARHALAALSDLQERDAPSLRTGVAADLVLDLLACGQSESATLAAARLSSFSLTVPPAERIRPLLVLAAERIAAGHEDEALGPLSQIKSLVREPRNRLGEMHADQLIAQAHRQAGRQVEAIRSLRDAARGARWLGDDLGATEAERARYLTAELAARALAMRLALDAARFTEADEEAMEMLRRVAVRGLRPVLPASVLWEHEVDARIGRMLAAARPGEPGAESRARARVYATRRAEAVGAISRAPGDCEERERFWSVYLADRDAAMREHLGDLTGAIRSARTALDGWERLGESQHRERLAADIARMETATL